ncbi:MAG: Lrp/AsnC family transcriptional regulator [Candidatus Woesearchaeota archaeon]|nr:Lrp/AsnC family transcriptional regulator [Candidatus Woesearchaeota archaeon]
MDETDVRIISYLRENARINLTRLSRETNIPISTIFDRLKKFDGVIKKHTVIVDFSRLGFDIKVNFILKVDKQNRDRLRDFLMKDIRVNSVYKINNGYDFLVEAIFSDMKEANEFTEKLEPFKVKSEEYYILDEIKREAFMSDPPMLDLLFIKPGKCLSGIQTI